MGGGEFLTPRVYPRILKSCAQTDSSLVTAPRFMCGNMFIVVKAESSSRFMSLSSGNALEFPVQI